MSDTESPGRLRETSPQAVVPPRTAFASGRWWWQRHFHVPVIIWMVASVLGGAAIGSALDASVRPKESPAVIDPGAADECDANYAECVPVASDVDCTATAAATNAVAGIDEDGPSYVAEPVAVVGDDVYDLDADNNGIGCD